MRVLGMRDDSGQTPILHVSLIHSQWEPVCTRERVGACGTGDPPSVSGRPAAGAAWLLCGLGETVQGNASSEPRV
jgi:hypothetical protein